MIAISHVAFAQGNDHKLNVVATYSILGDWVHQVGGTDINLTVLVGRESDVHTFEPTPADAIALAEADVIFENGLGLEYWLDKLYKASNSKAERVIISDGIAFLTASSYLEPRNKQQPLLDKKACKPCCCSCAHEDKEKQIDANKPAAVANEASATESHRAHDHGEDDPQFWFDVNRAMISVLTIRDTLADIDEKHAAYYEERANTYIASLVVLDNWIKKQVSVLPKDQRILVSNHDNLAYFAQRYHFCYLGSVLDSVTTDTQDPSAQKFAQLVDLIKANQVRAVFGENIQNPILIDQLAREAGLPKPILLYTGALGKEGSEGSTYVDMMHYNVNAIVKALNNK